MRTPRKIVVIGAGLAGLRVSESLRQRGYDGCLLLAGDEGRLPYDRPPLSKQVLTGEAPADSAALCTPEGLRDLDIDAHLESAANGLAAGRVHFTNGASTAYDAVIIATGASARLWPRLNRSQRVHYLRTAEDSARLKLALDSSKSLVIVGGGFIGQEVAAAARRKGLAVTVLEALTVPLEGAVGIEVGACLKRLHEEAGVRIVSREPVARIRDTGTSVEVMGRSGAQYRAEHVLIGIGTQSNVGWLRGTGLAKSGVIECDSSGQAGQMKDVWALGDVAAWRQPMDGDYLSNQHWTSAMTQAPIVAAAVLGEPITAPCDPPYFWSTQYDVNFQLCGRPDLATRVEILEGGQGDRGSIYGYFAGQRLVAVAGLQAPGLFNRYRAQLREQVMEPVSRPGDSQSPV